MFTRLRMVFLIIGFFMLTSSAIAAPLFNLQPGERFAYSRTAPGPVNWTSFVDVLHTDVINGNAYTHIESTNHDNDGKVHNSYLRVTETEAWSINREHMCGEKLALKTDAPGNAWSNTAWDRYCNVESTENCSIISTGSITVPAGTFTTVYQVRCAETRTVGGYSLTMITILRMAFSL